MPTPPRRRPEGEASYARDDGWLDPDERKKQRRPRKVIGEVTIGPYTMQVMSTSDDDLPINMKAVWDKLTEAHQIDQLKEMALNRIERIFDNLPDDTRTLAVKEYVTNKALETLGSALETYGTVAAIPEKIIADSRMAIDMAVLRYINQSLPREYFDAISKSLMEDVPETIIREEPVAGQHQTETVAHPEPTTAAELKVVASEATYLEGVVTAIRERGSSLSATEAEIAIDGLHKIAERSDGTARQLALHAIERGLISQVTAARLLGVSHGTVSRWYHESEKAKPSPMLKRKAEK